MLRRHSDILKSNLTELVNRTDLSSLLPELIAGDVFTADTANRIMSMSDEGKLQATSIYLEVRRRGPHAFSALVNALNASGHSDLGNLLLNADARHQVSPSPPDLHNSEDSLDSSPPHVCRIPSSVHPFQLPQYLENNVMDVLRDGYTQPDDLVSLYYDGLNETVVVKHSVKLNKSDGLPPDLYRMTSKPRGFALIINNVHFDDYEAYPLRRGAERDHIAMKSLLNQLYFEVECHLDKTKREMINIVENFASMQEWATVDCAWIILMSHGKEGDSEEDTEIIGTDGFGFKTRDIISYFHNDACPLLLHKPKIFIFQSCRGDLSDQGVEVDLFSHRRAHPPRTETDGRARPRTIRDRTRSDMFVAHPVPPGIKANRDRFAGTWFIQTIVDVFARFAYKCDLEDLFKIVDQNIKNMLNPGYPNFQSVTTRTIGWNKKLYFNPGLSFQDGHLVHENIVNDSGMDVVDTPRESQITGKNLDKIRLTEVEEDDSENHRLMGCFPCGPS